MGARANQQIQLPKPMHLRLDSVLPAEHVVDALEVVDALGDGVGAARGRVALLQVGLLSQVAHLEAVSSQSQDVRGVSLRTSSYTSGATVRRADSLSFRFNVFWMVSVEPLTLSENKLEARPLP